MFKFLPHIYIVAPILMLVCTISTPSFADSTKALHPPLTPAASRQAQAISALKAKAENGDENALRQLIIFYESGHAAGSDWSDSVKLLQKEADQGSRWAQSELSSLYAHGKGVPQNWAESCFWMENTKRDEIDHTYWASRDPCMYLTLEQRTAVKKRVAEWQPAWVSVRKKAKYAHDSAALVDWKQAADMGDRMAEWHLGEIYSHGDGVSQNWDEAYYWYLLAEYKKQLGAGTTYFTGRAAQHLTSQQIDEAKERVANWKPTISLATELANKGDVPAIRDLIKLFREGRGVPQNLVEAYFWSSLGGFNHEIGAGLVRHLTPEQISEVNRRLAEWYKAHPLPLAPGIHRPAPLGSCAEGLKKGNAEFDSPYSQPIHVLNDWKPCLKQDMLKAAQGDADAQFRIGEYYYYRSWGSSSDQGADRPEAIKWLKKSAAQGNVRALTVIANLYMANLIRFDFDAPDPVRLLREAANKGYRAAQGELGFLYGRNDMGVKKDDLERRYWLQMAAMQQTPPVQVLPMDSVEISDQVDKKLTGELGKKVMEAVWKGDFITAYREASEADRKRCVLGYDFPCTLQWKAALQGDANAQYNEANDTVSEMPVTAYVLYSLAARGGIADASTSRSALAKHMAESQLADAKLILKSWKPAVFHVKKFVPIRY